MTTLADKKSYELDLFFFTLIFADIDEIFPDTIVAKKKIQIYSFSQRRAVVTLNHDIIR